MFSENGDTNSAKKKKKKKKKEGDDSILDTTQEADGTTVNVLTLI